MKDLFLLSSSNKSLLFYLFAFLLIALTFYLGYSVEQSDFYSLIGAYGGFFLLYILIFRTVKTQREVMFFVYVSILLRVVLVFALPFLSDDLYRFIWDGHLIVNGYNPFDHLPSYFIENQIEVQGLSQALYDQLNSPNYFTIYPPVAQGTFALAVWLFPNSILGASIVMKCFLLAAEIGSLFLIIRLLSKFRLSSNNILLYALNPLIIIEIMGNLHFEGMMIFFLLLCFWLSLNEKILFAGGAMALSIASKLLPLIFLPFFIKRLGLKKMWGFFIVLGVVLLLLFAPLLNGLFFSNFGESLDLYFRKFEFNASFYFILRYIGYQSVGYNMISQIGPFLALGTFLLVISIAFFEKQLNWNSLPLKCLIAICIYLAFTTTVHPWYTALPIVLCVFTRFRFPILWSALIMFTYINYSYKVYQDNYFVVGLEYLGVVLFLVYEIYSHSPNRLSHNT